MVIIGNRTNLAVGEEKVLGFERVAAAHNSAIDGYKELVVDAGLRRRRQPARLGPAIEHYVLVLTRLPEALIEVRYRGLVLGTIGLNDDGHDWKECECRA